MFHRLTVPSYFGGLPAGYDYINNAISGTPAPADGQKAGGPNIGTYFVAFGEDATSSDANRANAALATNTDFLDDLMRRDLAQVTETANVGPTVGPTPSVTLVGPGIFLGVSVFTPLTELFQVTDANDNDIESGGVKVVVASFTGGAVGGGFSAGNVVLTFNVPIPTGTTYHIYYGTRTNLATMPADVLFADRLGRGDQADFEDFVKQISTPGVVGANVTSLDSAVFATPDGTRLPQSAFMLLAVDPNDTGATFRSVLTATRNNTINAAFIHQLLDDPTFVFRQGIASSSHLLTSLGGSFGVPNGTLFLEDSNLTPPTNFIPAIPLDSSVGADGDQWIRTLEKLPTSGVLGTHPDSILKKLNSKWACTVGDGVNSFGDFNGANALDQALAFFTASGAFNANIQVKQGAYTMTTTHTLTPLGAVVIEGQGSENTLITFNIPGSAGGLLLNSGALFLKRLNIENALAATSETTIGGNVGTSLSLEECVFVDMIVELVDPGTLPALGALPNGKAFYAKGCTFRVTQAFSQTCVVFALSDGLIHNGFTFDQCFFWMVDNTSPVIITQGAAPAGVTTMTSLEFLDTTYLLGGTTVNAGTLNCNTGILTIGSAGPAGDLIIFDVVFRSCKATATAGAGTVQCLAEIQPVPFTATSAANFVPIRRLTFEDSDFFCTFGTATAINPWTVVADKIEVNNCRFLGTGTGGGAPSTAIQWGTAGGAHSYPTGEWGQFTFMVSAHSLAFFIGVDNGIFMDDVSFQGFGRLSDCGDLFVELPNLGNYVLSIASSSCLRNVRVWGYNQNGSGTTPRYRVHIAGTTELSAFNDVETIVENLQVVGINSTGAEWTSGAATTRGIIGIEPLIGLKFSKCSVSRFTSTGTIDNGYFINYGSTSASTSYGIELLDCKANNMSGFGVIVPAGTSASVPLDKLVIVGGDYSFTIGGIALRCWNVGGARIERTRITNCTQLAIEVAPQTGSASFSNKNSVFVLDNYCFNNNGGGAGSSQISIGGTLIGGDRLFGFARGNVCLDSSYNVAAIHFPPTLATPADLNGNYGFGGIETGIDTTGGGAGLQFEYVNGNMMMQNFATLTMP